MGIKAVMVNFSNTGAGRNAVRAAMGAAHALKANLRVLYVLRDASCSLDLLGEGLPASEIANAIAEARAAARADAERARAEMVAILAAAGVPLTEGRPPRGPAVGELAPARRGG